jgi:NAD+ synthase
VSVAPSLSPDVLAIDAPDEAQRIAAAIARLVPHRLRRKGVVLGLSGGVDSSVAAALCVRALGPGRVLGLLMPEADSSPESTQLGRLLADMLGIECVLEDISPILTAAGCYRRRDDAIRAVVPEYDERYRCKIVLPNLLDGDRYPLYSIVVRSPGGVERRARLTLEAYLGIVAATNFKQRTRKMIEYYHADRRQYAVVGTPNRLENDQGFFVKNGDGAADLKPIAHLYKSQVYALAAHLDIPEEIRRRPATTDTYSLGQSQEEFYFGLPLATLDLALYARDHGVPADAAAPGLGLSPAQAQRVYRIIDGKRQATRYQHLAPLLVEDVEVAS